MQQTLIVCFQVKTIYQNLKKSNSTIQVLLKKGNYLFFFIYNDAHLKPLKSQNYLSKFSKPFIIFNDSI